MEFEFNSNDGAAVAVDRSEENESINPLFGPGDGDAFIPEDWDAFIPMNFEDEDEEYTEDFFDYPVQITQRIEQVSHELHRLRQALAVEKECLKLETVEVAALTSLEAQALARPASPVTLEYENTASPYEPQDISYQQGERRRQAQAMIQKERYMRQMMEVEKMCSEEFFNLNQTRAKVDKLNREISDWRLANGTVTGFGPYPMEIMRSGEPPYYAGPSATIPGRFTVNQPLTSSGIKSVPNVSVPVTEMVPMSASSFNNNLPWVQTFCGAMQNAQRGSSGADTKDAWKIDEETLPGNWRSGDADDRLSPVRHF